MRTCMLVKRRLAITFCFLATEDSYQSLFGPVNLAYCARSLQDYNKGQYNFLVVLHNLYDMNNTQ
nr:unnamed protein product [Callosobruchus analis]